MSTKWGHQFTCPSRDRAIIFTTSSKSREGLGVYRAQQYLLPLFFKPWVLVWSREWDPRSFASQSSALRTEWVVFPCRCRGRETTRPNSSLRRELSKRDGDGNIYVKKATQLISSRTPLHVTVSLLSPFWLIQQTKERKTERQMEITLTGSGGGSFDVCKSKQWIHFDTELFNVHQENLC